MCWATGAARIKEDQDNGSGKQKERLHDFGIFYITDFYKWENCIKNGIGK